MMPVPASLEATSEPMHVKSLHFRMGSNPMMFGEWQVVDFKKNRRPCENSQHYGIEPVTYSRTKGFAAYSFKLAAEGRDAWECYCETRNSHHDIGVGRIDDSFEVMVQHQESLDCELQRVGSDEFWRLRVIGSLAPGGDDYRGTLHSSTDDRAFLLESSHTLGKIRIPGPPTGYVFDRDGSKIAATDYTGFVRIGQEAGQERDVLATAAAALLMQPGPI